jgi:uncharacterized protein
MSLNEANRPRRVVELLLQGIQQGRWTELPALYAEDAEVELPLALPAPRRLHGREALRAHFAAAAAAPLDLAVRDLVIREMTDPELVVAEYVYDGRARTTGRTFSTSNIHVVRVRAGRIVASRDFHDHLRLAEAAGALPRLIGPDGRIGAPTRGA